MSSEDKKIDGMREAWSRATDDDVLKAALEDWDGYTAEAQRIINEEISKRKLDRHLKPITGVHIKPHEPILKQWMRSIRLILLLILSVVPFVLLNLGLWSYYEWRDNHTLERIDNLERILNTEKIWLESTERRLQNKESELEKLVKDTSAWEKAVKSQDVRPSELTIKEYNILYTEYEDRLRKYNEKVEEYNSLIEKEVSRWYPYLSENDGKYQI
jgi:hypothetical protein